MFYTESNILEVVLGIGTIILIILIVFVVIKICRKCKTSKATSLLHENTLHFYITVFIKHYNTHLVLLLFVLVFILLSNLFFIWSNFFYNVFSVSSSCTFSDNRNGTVGNRSNTELTLNYNTCQWRPDSIEKRWYTGWYRRTQTQLTSEGSEHLHLFI